MRPNAPTSPSWRLCRCLSTDHETRSGWFRSCFRGGGAGWGVSAAVGFAADSGFFAAGRPCLACAPRRLSGLFAGGAGAGCGHGLGGRVSGPCCGAPAHTGRADGHGHRRGADGCGALLPGRASAWDAGSAGRSRLFGRGAGVLLQFSRRRAGRAVPGGHPPGGAGAGRLPSGPLCGRHLPFGCLSGRLRTAGTQPVTGVCALRTAHGAFPPAAPVPAPPAGRGGSRHAVGGPHPADRYAGGILPGGRGVPSAVHFGAAFLPALWAVPDRSAGRDASVQPVVHSLRSGGAAVLHGSHRLPGLGGAGRCDLFHHAAGLCTGAAAGYPDLPGGRRPVPGAAERLCGL